MQSPTEARPLDRRVVISALGVVQILAWGTSFYFPAVFAEPIVQDTGWSLGWVVAGTSIGLLVAGLAPMLPVYLFGWALIGIGMGTGLYDAVFAALGRLYGSDARGPITNLTLFGGFASTVCWPLSAFMIEHAGWRVACLIYAAIHLCVALPLQMAVVRRAPAQVLHQDAQGDVKRPAAPAPIENETFIFALLAVVLSILAGIGSIVIVNFMIFLQARGVDYAVAVGLGTLFGPAQVGARVVERVFGSHYHPIWTMIASCGLMAIGLIMLTASFPVLLLIVLIYGAGYGISWIGRGTLPLTLFGPVRFPRLMGKLAFPSLIVQALAPSAGALLIEAYGPNATIGLLTGLALINVVLIGVLWMTCRARIASET